MEIVAAKFKTSKIYEMPSYITFFLEMEGFYRKISHIADAVAERYAAMSEIAMCE